MEQRTKAEQNIPSLEACQAALFKKKKIGKKVRTLYSCFSNLYENREFALPKGSIFMKSNICRPCGMRYGTYKQKHL